MGDERFWYNRDPRFTADDRSRMTSYSTEQGGQAYSIVTDDIDTRLHNVVFKDQRLGAHGVAIYRKIHNVRACYDGSLPPPPPSPPPLPPFSPQPPSLPPDPSPPPPRAKWYTATKELDLLETLDNTWGRTTGILKTYPHGLFCSSSRLDSENLCHFSEPLLVEVQKTQDDLDQVVARTGQTSTIVDDFQSIAPAQLRVRRLAVPWECGVASLSSTMKELRGLGQHSAAQRASYLAFRTIHGTDKHQMPTYAPPYAHQTSPSTAPLPSFKCTEQVQTAKNTVELENLPSTESLNALLKHGTEFKPQQSHRCRSRSQRDYANV